MALIATLLVSWLLVAFAAAWAMGKAAHIGGAAEDAPRPAATPLRMRRPYSSRKTRRKGEALSGQRRPAPTSTRVPTRISGRSVH